MLVVSVGIDRFERLPWALPRARLDKAAHPGTIAAFAALARRSRVRPLERRTPEIPSIEERV